MTPLKASLQNGLFNQMHLQCFLTRAHLTIGESSWHLGKEKSSGAWSAEKGSSKWGEKQVPDHYFRVFLENKNKREVIAVFDM